MFLKKEVLIGKDLINLSEKSLYLIGEKGI